MYNNVAFPIIAILSWIKTQHFSKKILANYTSYRNILCTKRFVSLRGIFWYKPCLYTTYLLLGKCETCMKVLPFYFGSFYYRSKHSFSKNFKRRMRPTETCYVPNDWSHLGESFSTKDFSVQGIFRLQIGIDVWCCLSYHGLHVIDQNPTLFTKF